MKHCPNEDCTHRARFGGAAEFLDRVRVCPDCGGPLLPGEAPPAPTAEYRELSTVYETDDRIRAHLIRSVLEDMDIPAHISGESLQGAMGELPLTMLSLKIQVPPEHARRAREIALECERRPE